MDIVYRLLFIIFTLNLFYATEALSNIVITPSGAVNGTFFHHKGSDVKAFLGIPYAKPPVGNLRFKKTVPAEPWNGVLQARSFAPACLQYTIFPLKSAVHPPDLSEDCLYLNIWAPMDASPRNKKTVMFFVHGGAFVASSSRIDRYHGHVLAAEGDLVVVTFDYRLGVQGFFYSGTEDAPGNMGMWDMVEALKWVNNNIESFGGDKDSITMFGQSAGGTSVGMLAVSPVTRGLFKRIIMTSGFSTDLGGENNDKDFDISLRLAKKVGCSSAFDTDAKSSFQMPNHVVECVKRKNPYELDVLLSNVTDRESKRFYPRFGDAFLPEDPRRTIIEGDFDASDALVGSNSGDGALLLNMAKTDVFGLFGEKNPEINHTFGESIIRDQFRGKKNVDSDAVVRHYLGDVDEYDYWRIRQQVFTAIGDYERICPGVYLAESFNNKGASTYYYFFTHRTLNSAYAPWMLAAHSDELPFVFGKPLRHPYQYSQEEIDLSKRMIHIWSTFAKIGKPPGNWLLYSKESPYYHILDTISCDLNEIGPHKRNCDFFRPAFGVRKNVYLKR